METICICSYYTNGSTATRTYTHILYIPAKIAHIRWGRRLQTSTFVTEMNVKKPKREVVIESKRSVDDIVLVDCVVEASVCVCVLCGAAHCADMTIKSKKGAENAKTQRDALCLHPSGRSYKPLYQRPVPCVLWTEIANRKSKYSSFISFSIGFTLYKWCHYMCCRHRGYWCSIYGELQVRESKGMRIEV